MVYWHIETDLIALAIYFVLFIKAGVLNREKDQTDKIFSLALILGFVSTVIDIFSSAVMNDQTGWWIYEIGMILYGLSVPVLALLWFLYTVSLIYRHDEVTLKRFLVVFGVLYALYAVIIVTNPIHELYFHLTDKIVYSRGDWFLPLIVWSQTFLGGLGILLLVLNRKKIGSHSIFWLLFLLHSVTMAVYYVQIAHPGWLIVDSTYAVALLVCDATFESRRRDDLYKTIKASLDQLQADKEKEMAYQKELEAAVQAANQASQAKSEFLSRMSHDIRTPINGIRGMLGIIHKERHNDERVDDCLEKINIASGHLLSLINDILEMSHLESGDILLSHEPFDLRQVTADCVAILSQTAVDNGILLSTEDLERHVSHPYLIGSPLHVRQILLNIIGNAIKYNRPGGSVHCTLEEAECSKDQAVFRFVVEDTGIGISEEFLPYVFQPFSQEHAGSRTHYEGTGLGLSIVKKIVDKMGGIITVESKLNEGSTFTFTLPFQIDHAPAVPDPDDPSEEEEISLEGVHLLLVEDNALNLEIAQFVLENSGALVTTAENGKEAVALFRDSAPGTYQVILMDIMMPEMDGLEATRIIRDMERPDAKKVPIIAMTANAFSEDAKKCLDAGMNAHLAKPLDASVLLKKLTEFL